MANRLPEEPVKNAKINISKTVMKVQEAFHLLDREGKGYILTSDVISIMKLLDMTLSDRDISAIIQCSGVDDDGKITCEDFIAKIITK